MPAGAQQSRQVLHSHVRPVVASGEAKPVGRLPAAQRLSVAIMLPLRNQSKLTSLLAQMYDASNPAYRHFLSVAQFTEQFGPAAEDYQAVVDFAKANGLTVTATPANRMLVDVSGTVAQIENAFHVAMMIYRHPTENRTFYSPDREPSLDLVVPVSHIAGLNNYSIPRPTLTKAPMTASARGNVGSGPGGVYLGSDMRAAYYGGTALTGVGQVVGLFEFSGYDLSDVNLTFSSAGQSYSVPINNVLIDGASGAPNGDDAEEVLDIVQAISMAPGLSQVRVYIAPPVLDVDLLNQMATENIAKQLSCSWLWNPEDPASDDPIFQEFAAQGQNFFVASGDYGAWENFNLPYYFPAEDAYVTAVGGTQLTTNGAGGPWESETAWNSVANNLGYYASGGGISPDGIVIPLWQKGSANSSNAASATVRNVPDVAAEANTDNYVCDLGVCDGGWGGTSFSAPRWAGFLALVNQQVVASGQSTVGFINPALYAIGLSSAYDIDFHDITSGNNDVTAGITGGFNAVPGYDLVTGWGSPNGQSLIDALPATNFAISASPSSLTLLAGGAAGTSTIALSAANGFSGSVALAATGLPSGVSATFNPASISGSGISKLVLTASGSVTAGNPTVTIAGTSGGVTTTTTIALSVDFSLAVSPGAQTVTAGKSTSFTTTITMKSGFKGSVDLSVSGLPTGATGTFTPPSLSASGTSTLVISTASATPTGTYPLAITGTTGALTQSANVSLVINAVTNNFTVSASPNSLTIGAETVATGYSILTISSQNGFSSPVTLSATGFPPGVTAVFTPNTVTPAADGSVSAALALSLVTWPSPYGSFTVVVTGTSGYEVASTKVSLTISPVLYVLTIFDQDVIVNPGNSTSITMFASGPDSFSSPITFSVTGLPTGVTGAFLPNPLIPQLGYGSTTLTLTASPTAALGSSAYTVNSTSGAFAQSGGGEVTVSSSGYTMGTSPASLTLPQKGTASSVLTLTSQNGFHGGVGFYVTGLPDGVNYRFSPSFPHVKPNGSASTTLELVADAAATTGTFPATVTGSFLDAAGNWLVNTTNISVTVPASGHPTYVTLAAFNRTGIFLDGQDTDNLTKGLDLHGHAYSANLLGAWSQSWAQTPFSIDTQTFAPTVISCAGQTIPLPSGQFSSLRLLGTGVNGGQISQTFIVTYTDGSTTMIIQNLSDWEKPENYSGESKGFTMAYADNVYNGGRIPQPTYLYGYSFALNNAKTVQSVTLPNNSNVEVLALTLVP